MRPARVLMNLGRASALAGGPRRRGADREAWNRSRRTLLRAQEAAERTGTSLGEEAVKLEAQLAARERTEREREAGINAPPFSYEPGEFPATDRPASYFVWDPEARARLEARETAGQGYDPDRQARANRAYREQIAAVSRGTEPQRGAAEIAPGQVTEADLAAAYTGHAGPGGTLKPRWNPLTGQVATPEGQQAAMNWLTENRRRINMGFEPFENPEMMAARRAQMGQQESEAEAAARVAPRLAEAEAQGQEALARGAGAAATMMEGQALPAQHMIELWQTPEGKQQVVEQWARASEAEKRNFAEDLLTGLPEDAPPELRQRLLEIATGMKKEIYAGDVWTTGGLGSVLDLLAFFGRGWPERERWVPAQETGPAPATSIPTPKPTMPPGGGNWAPVVYTSPTWPLRPRGGGQAGTPAAGAQAGAGQAIPGNLNTETATDEELAALIASLPPEQRERLRALLGG